MYRFNVVLGLLDELLELKEYVKHESEANHFSLHHSIISFLNGWENLHYELGIETERGNVYRQTDRQTDSHFTTRGI